MAKASHWRNLRRQGADAEQECSGYVSQKTYKIVNSVTPAGKTGADIELFHAEKRLHMYFTCAALCFLAPDFDRTILSYFFREIFDFLIKIKLSKAESHRV